MTLSGLVDKYAAKRRRLTYSQLIQEIVAHNAEKLSRGLGRVSGARYRLAADRALGKGTLDMPAWDTVVPPRAYFLKKAMQGGEVISDTLRRRMTASLRAALESSPPGGQLDPAAVSRMEAAVREAMAPYTRGGPDGKAPPNAHTIAVTEVRSAFDEAKYEYARKMALTNTDRVSMHKVWRHNSHLVKVPRDGHLALNGARVGFYETFTVVTPSGAAIQMLHPHAPHAPIGEVAGCQCGYDIVVVPLQGTGVGKSMDVLKARGPVPKVGDVVTRPDGTKWVKTGTFSYRKATQAEEATGRAAPGSEGSQGAKPAAEPGGGAGKAPTMTAEAAWGVLDRVGRGGFWNLTKDGLTELLKAEGMDPSKMKFEEKKQAVYAAMDRKKQKDLEENTVKVPPLKIYSNKNFTGMTGTTKIEDEVKAAMDDAKPQPGGHWGSAESKNKTAQAVAFSSGTKWRPIDKLQDGKLAEYESAIDSDTVYKAVAYRQYAQDRISGLSRKEQPAFYRGMTLTPDEWEEIRSGKSDTVELTGCTAFSCFEKIADRYSKSNWTKQFGRSRKPVKIVLERGDDVDKSIGMWHQTFHEKQDRSGSVKDPAFELLSGLEALRVVKVDAGEDVESLKVKRMKKLPKDAAKEIQERLDHNAAVIENMERNLKPMVDRLAELEAGSPPRPGESVEILNSSIGYKRSGIDQYKLSNAGLREDLKIAAGYDMEDEHNRHVFHLAAVDWEVATALDQFSSNGGDGQTMAEFVSSSPNGLFDDGARLGSIRDELLSDPHFAMMKRGEAEVHYRARKALHAGNYVDWYKKALQNPKAMVLHCVAGRGKKSVTGGDEGIEEEKKDGN